MKLQSVLALAAMAGLASSASAQFFTGGVTANVTLSFVEDPLFPPLPGGTLGNGILEPGEHAAIRMNFSFTHQTTTGNYSTNNPGLYPGPVSLDLQSFSPAVGAFSSGYIRGLGTAYLSITSPSSDSSGLYNGGVTSPTGTSVGPNAGNTGTTGYGVRGGWRLGGNTANGQPAANGFVNLGPGQLPTDPANDPSGVNLTNPLNNLERLGWAPTSYASRTVTFNVGGAAGAGNQAIGLYVDVNSPGVNGNGFYVAGSTGAVVYVPLANVNFGSVNIPIAPAPASLALLGLGGLVIGRRRR